MTSRIKEGGSALLLAIALPLVVYSQAPEACNWRQAGKDRKPVKNRTPRAGENYEVHNNGEPISVAEFLALVCSFADDLPAKKNIPAKRSLARFETIKITVRGFLLAAKFERGEDHDIHAQIGDEAQFETDQIIVEVPAGRTFCMPRKALWGLVKQDRVGAGKSAKIDSWRLENPPEVIIEGFLFIDKFHIHSQDKNTYCKENGGRGLQKDGVSRVKGLWEIHPVLSVERVSN